MFPFSLLRLLQCSVLVEAKRLESFCRGVCHVNQGVGQKHLGRVRANYNFD